MVWSLPAGQLHRHVERMEEQQEQESVDEGGPGGHTAWPTYQEEKMPRPEDVRRRNLKGPLPTLVLGCVLASMEEVEDVVPKMAVDNLHPRDAILRCTRQDLVNRNGVCEQVEVVGPEGVGNDMQEQS